MKKSTLLILTLLLSPWAQAHVVLEHPQAPAGSYYVGSLIVPHGCDGSATVAIRVRFPEGIITIKPQPKTGWTLSTKDGPYAKPQKLHGTTLTHGVREVTWRGGPLADAEFDQFRFIGYILPAQSAGSKLHIPVVQECEQGVARWIDTSDDEQSPNPAPYIKLTPADNTED